MTTQDQITRLQAQLAEQARYIARLEHANRNKDQAIMALRHLIERGRRIRVQHGARVLLGSREVSGQ